MTTTLSSGIPSLVHSTTFSPGLAVMCPCNARDEEAAKSELEINASKMREVMKNKTDLLSKIHHRATHSSDAYWASFILTSMGLSLVISVFTSKMWKDKEFFITYTHSQPTVYPQFSPKGEIPVKDMLISKARTAAASKRRGEDEPDSSSSIYHMLLSQYSSFSHKEIDEEDSYYSSDEDLSPNEEDGYMYYYDTRKEQWIVGVRPHKDKRPFWSSFWSNGYRRDKVSYTKLSSEVNVESSSDSDPEKIS